MTCQISARYLKVKFELISSSAPLKLECFLCDRCEEKSNQMQEWTRDESINIVEDEHNQKPPALSPLVSTATLLLAGTPKYRLVQHEASVVHATRSAVSSE
jgi:hypothetical protein